eukprot:g26410.t1
MMLRKAVFLAGWSSDSTASAYLSVSGQETTRFVVHIFFYRRHKACASCPAANTIQVLKMVSQRMKRSGPGIVEDVASRTDEALKMGTDDAGVETGSSLGNGSPSTYISSLSRA